MPLKNECIDFDRETYEQVHRYTEPYLKFIYCHYPIISYAH